MAVLAGGVTLAVLRLVARRALLRQPKIAALLMTLHAVEFRMRTIEREGHVRVRKCVLVPRERPHQVERCAVVVRVARDTLRLVTVVAAILMQLGIDGAMTGAAPGFQPTVCVA